MTIFDYAKLSNSQKETLLRDEALLLEVCAEEKDMIIVYFLNGFFVEVTINKGKVIYNLPYQRGYKMDSPEFLKVEEQVA